MLNFDVDIPGDDSLMSIKSYSPYKKRPSTSPKRFSIISSSPNNIIKAEMYTYYYII